MMRARGFTLLELLIAMTILTIIAAIIYATLSSVLNVTDDARADTIEMRLREFLVTSFTTNLSSTYADSQFQQEVYLFVGEDQDGPHGPADALRFCSTSPLAGAPAMPGDVKEVRYEVESEEAEGGPLDLGVTENTTSALAGIEGLAAYRTLRALETPLLGGNVQEIDNENGFFVPDPSYQSPSWSLPIRTLNLRYFDGVDWVEDWNSIEMGRLPWCVEVKINFARTEAQLQAESSLQLDPEEDADLTLVVTIPVALGTDENTRFLEEQRMQQEWMQQQGMQGGGGQGGTAGGQGGFGGGNQGATNTGGGWSGGGGGRRR